jgi:hypothetical protein
MPLPTWEIDLNIYGPLTIKGLVHLREPKGFSLPDPFQSDVRIKASVPGLQITATAYASTIQNARKVTLVFIGYMLDTLASQVNLPIILSYLSSRSNRVENYGERRIITSEEWHNAFYEARLLALAEPTFLRALGWYRKGLYTEDILDSFLAFWNAIEIVAGKYHPKNERARQSKGQIWECFKLIWGECPDWPIIPGQMDWIDRNYEYRVSIAHGTQPITIESVEEIIGRLPVIREVAYAFLSSWRSTQLHPQIPMDLQHQFGY